MRSIAFILRRRRSEFGAVLLLSLVFNTGTTLLTPLFLQNIFDRGIAAKDMPRFVGMMAAFIVIATAWRLLNLLQNLRTQKLKQAVLRDLTAEMVGKFYRLPFEAASAFPPAYCASRIYDEPLAASAMTIDLALEISAGAACFAAAAALLAHLSPRAALLLAVCVPFLILLANKYSSAIKSRATEEKEEEGRLRGFITRAAQAYRSVNLFGLGPGVSSALAERLSAFTSVSYQRVRSSGVHNTAASIIMSIVEMLVILACGFEMMRGRMTLGGFMAFMSAFWAAVGSLRALMQKAPELAKNDALVQRISDFLSAAEAPKSAEAASAESSLKNVTFKYGEKTVLSGVDLTIGLTDKVLLSGRNGSGKSTLANILSTFLTPLKGEARTVGIERISACLTPHHFIPGTIGDNLAVDALTAGKKDYLSTLLREFNLEGMLDRDPEELSTGQRKKVEVIMGLLKDADLYIFDEPLANVDVESKSVILNRIFQRTEGKALVVVMHGDDELKTRFHRVVELSAGAPRAAAIEVG